MRTWGSTRQGSRAIYVCMALLIPFANSLINPVLSLFATLELKLTALQVSFLFMLLPVATVVIVQLCGRYSDKGLERPLIITVAALCGLASCVLLSLRPPYWILCTAGMVLMGAYSVSFPQLFASAREFSLRYLSNALMFTTVLRALCSLAWVGGPPIAYFMVSSFSFDLLFIIAGSMFTLGALLAFSLLPSISLPKDAAHEEQLDLLHKPQLLLLFIGTAGIFTAFSGYIISMPLFVVQELQLPEKLPGAMFALAAFLEIPIMLIAAKVARRVGLKRIMFTGFGSLVLFLMLMCVVEHILLLLLMQLLSALFIGLVSSMGMVFFQELEPKLPGQATSLFVNAGTVGQILGGALFALADLGSYRWIYISGILLAVLSTAALALVKNPRRLL